MANTFTQLYVHIVFSVQSRQSLIPKQWKDEVEKYVAGILRNKKQKLLAMYCMPDHMHILMAMNPTVALSEIVRDVKANSSSFINEQKWMRGKFHWQEGFGAFSYSHSQLDNVIQYILNQEKHHSSTSFKEEYVMLLKKFDIKFEEKYAFDLITE